MKFEDAPDRMRTTCWLRKIAVLALAIPFLIIVIAERGSAAKRRLGVDDYLALESVGAPVISPDGKWVAYAVGSIDAEKNEAESAVWMVARAGGDPLRATESTCPHSVSISGNGSWRGLENISRSER